MEKLTIRSFGGSLSGKTAGRQVGRSRPGAHAQVGKGRLLAATLLGLVTVTGTASVGWVIQEMLFPSAAVAYTARVTLFLSREAGESYEGMLRRAEVVARAGVQRSFDADILTTEAMVTVVGENQGISVPILTVEVTRPQWRSQPDVQTWATYFESSQFLLGL